MTEIPEHLLKRMDAQKRAEGREEAHILERSKPKVDAITLEKRKEAREQPLHRRFRFKRVEDFSGVSGTGYVAQGVEFADGTCVVRWNSAMASTAIYSSMADLQNIHGHEGRTKIEWVDEENK